MADSIERLSFELSARLLEEQERALSSLRSSAGTVLGAASIAGSFLGSRSAGRALDAWSALALISFVLCVGSAIWVMVPRELVLSFRGRRLLVVGDALDSNDVEDAYRTVCRWIEPHLELNRSVLDRLAQWLTRSYALLAIEVVMWTISITL